MHLFRSELDGPTASPSPQPDPPGEDKPPFLSIAFIILAICLGGVILLWLGSDSCSHSQEGSAAQADLGGPSDASVESMPGMWSNPMQAPGPASPGTVRIIVDDVPTSPSQGGAAAAGLAAHGEAKAIAPGSTASPPPRQPSSA